MDERRNIFKISRDEGEVETEGLDEVRRGREFVNMDERDDRLDSIEKSVGGAGKGGGGWNNSRLDYLLESLSSESSTELNYFNDKAAEMKQSFIGYSPNDEDDYRGRLKEVEMENLKQKNGLIWWEEFGKMCADRIERGIEKNS